jgi:hypothetical protein
VKTRRSEGQASSPVMTTLIPFSRTYHRGERAQGGGDGEEEGTPM